MTTPHPQADLLRAIADGRQTQEEILDGASRRFVNCSAKRALQVIAKGCAQFIRIKPETVLINGIECNAPMRVEPEMGSWYYTPTPTNEAKFTLWAWLNDASGQRLFAESLCFATAEDAAAAARAMIAPLKLNGGEAGAALSTAAQPPAGWPRASISDSCLGWTLDYKFLDKVEALARSRTEYSTSMEAIEQVLIAALEVLATAAIDAASAAKEGQNNG